MIDTVIRLLKAYKTYLIGAAIALALIIGGKVYLNKVETDSYNHGVSVTQTANEAQRQEYKDQLAEKFKENSELTAALNARTREKEAALKALDTKLAEKQAQYSASPAGQVKGLDEQFIDIYNESLGE